MDPRREENLDSGREEDVGGRLRAVLARPEWRATVEGLSPQRRAWARDALDRLEAAGTAAAAAGTFRLHVVAGDPGRTGATVETRVLVDGRPLIAERFDKGGGEPPERVLDGRLRPGSPLTSAPDAKQIDWGAGRRCSCFAQPTDQVRQNPDVIHRGVRLAEAYCTEGCCGALYVTVDRDGPDVVWREGGGLRDVEGGVSPDGEGGVSPDALLRMPADVYEAELVRASADRGWEWPGRALARLLMARLREEPGIVGRWGCGPTWAVSRGGEEERGLVRLALEYPAGGCLLHDERWRQIRREWTVGPEPVGEQLERIVTELAATDPRVEG